MPRPSTAGRNRRHSRGRPRARLWRDRHRLRARLHLDGPRLPPVGADAVVAVLASYYQLNAAEMESCLAYIARGAPGYFLILNIPQTRHGQYQDTCPSFGRL